jgi:uncharacterized membrane protein
MEYNILFIMFAVLGVAHEVFWTSLLDFVKTKNSRLIGRSSVWMFPIYGCVLFIIILVQWLYSHYPWWFRGIMYAALMGCWEYLSGRVLKKLLGKAPWDYSSETSDDIGSPKMFHIHGLVCLEYIPVWFVEGLVAEWIYLFFQAHLIL